MIMIMIMMVIMIACIDYAPAKTIDQSVPSETITTPIPAFTVETVEPPASLIVNVSDKGRIIRLDVLVVSGLALGQV